MRTGRWVRKFQTRVIPRKANKSKPIREARDKPRLKLYRRLMIMLPTLNFKNPAIRSK